MFKDIRTTLLWLLAAGAILFLPCCLVVLVDSNPGTTYADHLSSAMLLLGAALLLILSPLPPGTVTDAVPEEHNEVFRYALRSGTLPIASLFSDWKGEIARRRRVLQLVLRALPTGTSVVIALELYGTLIDPAGDGFFLLAAGITAVFGAAMLAVTAIRLRNLCAVEDRLRNQTRLLERESWAN